MFDENNDNDNNDNKKNIKYICKKEKPKNKNN